MTLTAIPKNATIPIKVLLNTGANPHFNTAGYSLKFVLKRFREDADSEALAIFSESDSEVAIISDEQARVTLSPSVTASETRDTLWYEVRLTDGIVSYQIEPVTEIVLSETIVETIGVT